MAGSIFAMGRTPFSPRSSHAIAPLQSKSIVARGPTCSRPARLRKYGHIAFAAFDFPGLSGQGVLIQSCRG